MAQKKPINIFWFRRDFRLKDNAGLYHALKSNLPVLPFFIFDKDILNKLEDKNDARITFIHKSLNDLNKELNLLKSSLYVLHDTPDHAWETILDKFKVESVYTNHDYEPYARQRDSNIKDFLKGKGISFFTFKDQVIFEKDEILKDDKKPYTIYSPYKRKWLKKIKPFYLKSYLTYKYFQNLYPDKSFAIPSIESIGFKKSRINFPDKEYESVLDGYLNTRDFPSVKGTSRISVHLRFGTISIRDLVRAANINADKTWLQELIWREFYMMILWHFPHIVHTSFKPEFDNIRWRNNEEEFEAWCQGRTGYPIVDAGMRQLNETGWMHNRVRMITASFLTKHLLIDWRWGEAYFARKLIDYEQASNVGGWQWAAGSGIDAVPYFRIFNPDLQTKKFDPGLGYIRKWIPEIDDPFKYPKPIVEHQSARERALKAFKEAALSK
jgi:deoxyribodipyrimidine photo-lyase